MTTFNILVLPGDGVGPEVTAEAIKVLRVVESCTGTTFNLTHELVGLNSEEKRGVRITREVLDLTVKSDAVLFGSEGGPITGAKRVPGYVGSLLQLRRELNLYANLRPCRFVSKSLHHLSVLRPGLSEGTDIMLGCARELWWCVLRQKIEDDDYAEDTWAYSKAEVQRVARVAAALAKEHNPPLHVTSCDKANVLASGRLWRRVVTDTFAKEFPELSISHQLIDSAAMLMMKNPRMFNGVLLTENTFGDILSDESSAIPGSLGLLPSASLSGAPGEMGLKGLYEPIHGTAPDIAGKGIVNPIAQILSLAMLLDFSCGMKKESEAITQAVGKVLDSKSDGGLEIRTGDLGGNAKTSEVGDAVCQVLKVILNRNTKAQCLD
ncbi:hypothetical protein B7463_g3413, partial [Scytalidium lignicola]